MCNLYEQLRYFYCFWKSYLFQTRCKRGHRPKHALAAGDIFEGIMLLSFCVYGRSFY